MSLYRKVPQCRICKSQHGDSIDRDLLGRKTYQQILDKYAPLFPEDRPLTRTVLKSHWKHFKKAVEVTAVQRISHTLAPVALAEHLPPQEPERQAVFEAAVQDRVDEIQIMEKLVKSGLKDLDIIQHKEGENEFAVLNRDRVRKSTADIVMSSAKIKQMALQAEEDRHRQEMGRLAFRMFQLFGRSLEALPLENRGVVAAQLKEFIRDDDELNSLMKDQASKPSIKPGSDE
jgi:hypothetical protein